MDDRKFVEKAKSAALATLEPVRNDVGSLPPILVGRDTPIIRTKVERFYPSVAEIYEAWVTRCESKHTQRAHRRYIMSIVEFLEIRRPEYAHRLFTVTVVDELAWRDDMLAEDKAPKTLSRRVSSVSSFYKYRQGVAADVRLPITIPDPAHAQVISRSLTDRVEETPAISVSRAQHLAGLPEGETHIAGRDRAILTFFLYIGARLSTGYRLNVSDFNRDGEEYTNRINEKGNKRHTIGLHFAAGQTISLYLRLEAQIPVNRNTMVITAQSHRQCTPRLQKDKETG